MNEIISQKAVQAAAKALTSSKRWWTREFNMRAALEAAFDVMWPDRIPTQNEYIELTRAQARVKELEQFVDELNKEIDQWILQGAQTEEAAIKIIQANKARIFELEDENKRLTKLLGHALFDLSALGVDINLIRGITDADIAAEQDYSRESTTYS